MKAISLCVQVDSADSQGNPRDLLETEVTLIDGNLSSQQIELEQTAAGRYEGRAAAGEPGTYLVQVVQRDAAGQAVAQQTTGVVVPFSAEYKRSGQGDALPARVAAPNGPVLCHRKSDRCLLHQRHSQPFLRVRCGRCCFCWRHCYFHLM